MARKFRKMRYVQYSFEEASRWDSIEIVREELEGKLAAIRIDGKGDLAATGPAIEEENDGLSYFVVSSVWLSSVIAYSDSNGQSEREAAYPGKIINEPIARKIYEQR